MIVLLSTSDTDLLSARASRADYRLGNPARLDAAAVPDLLEAADLVVVRILGGRRAWEDGLDAVLASGVPVVVLGGEETPDAELMELSTVPGGVVAEAHAYLAQGGPANLAQLHSFLSDAVLLTGVRLRPPGPDADVGASRPQPPALDPGRPTVAVLYYRAHQAAGNTAFVARPGRRDRGRRRSGAAAVLLLAAQRRARTCSTTLRAGRRDRGHRARRRGHRCRPRSAPAAATTTGTSARWPSSTCRSCKAVPDLVARSSGVDSDDGLTPLDSATQVAIPEFDGRLITVPFSFKEIDAGRPDRPTSPTPSARPGWPASPSSTPGCATSRPPSAAIALMLSAYPTKHARIGNAVGLDTPASTVRAARGDARRPATTSATLPGRRRARRRRADPRADRGRRPGRGLADRGAAGRQPGPHRGRRLRALVRRASPADLRAAVERALGPGAGRAVRRPLAATRTARSCWPRCAAATSSCMVQPPRGFGANPVAIYHDPDLPPSHHYLAAYRWLRERRSVRRRRDGARRQARQPGVAARQDRRRCRPPAAPDAALGDLPLIYPFLVNDPGEGTQAKRRAHATLVDHLVPPMARAESYGDIARLEQLLDEHAQIAAMDPAKLPAVRAQIWTLIQAAKLDHDLGLDDRPHDAEFDEFILHVDGWLCEIKDAQIRDGLHVLGAGPGRARPGSTWCWRSCGPARCGPAQSQALPGLREALGLDEAALTLSADRRGRGAGPRAGRGDGGGRLGRRAAVDVGAPPGSPTAVADVLRLRRAPRWCPAWPAPPTRSTARAARARRRLRARPGRAARRCAGWSTCCRPAATSTPSTRGRCPSRLAWETGQAMADSLLERYRADTGECPRVGRPLGLGHRGDAHLRRRHRRGARPARRPPGLGRGLAPGQPAWSRSRSAELGRPRIDVTVRISGFFRDAFPHVVAHARRRGAAGRRARRAGRAELRARPRAGRPGRARRRAAGHRPGSSAPSRAPTGPGCCR